jgi:hypothetical protein
MPKVRVNDIEMYYEIHGKGTPLVHALPSEADIGLAHRGVRFVPEADISIIKPGRST